MKPAPEHFRITPEIAHRAGVPLRLATTAEHGNNGVFYIRHLCLVLRCIVSDGGGWEHVSVSLPNRCPTWEEMCVVKAHFWTDDETVIQYHPARAEYVNNHPFCLHLWRPTGAAIPTPPSYLVGLKS